MFQGWLQLRLQMRFIWWHSGSGRRGGSGAGGRVQRSRAKQCVPRPYREILSTVCACPHHTGQDTNWTGERPERAPWRGGWFVRRLLYALYAIYRFAPRTRSENCSLATGRFSLVFPFFRPSSSELVAKAVKLCQLEFSDSANEHECVYSSILWAILLGDFSIHERSYRGFTTVPRPHPHPKWSFTLACLRQMSVSLGYGRLVPCLNAWATHGRQHWQPAGAPGSLREKFSLLSWRPDWREADRAQRTCIYKHWRTFEVWWCLIYCMEVTCPAGRIWQWEDTVGVLVRLCSSHAMAGMPPLEPRWRSKGLQSHEGITGFGPKRDRGRKDV